MIAKRSALVILLLFLPATAFAAKRYVVKKGDNLYNLAKRFRVSLQAIKRANGLGSNRLNIGDTILIPDSKDREASISQKESAASRLASSGEYIVVQGDTLVGIGKKFRIPAEAIRMANNLKGSKLRVGERLVIPSSPKSTGKEVVVSKVSEAKEKEPIEAKSNLPSVSIRYIVKKGDTLGRIARQFGVSLEELRRANGLADNRLKIGRILTIPDSGSSVVVENSSSESVRIIPKEASSYQPREYIVKNGDTLGKIGKKFGVSVKDLKSTNGLKSNNIRVGMRLTIPSTLSATSETQVPREKETVSLEVNEDSRYIVKRGDSLNLIAKKFKVSVEDLKRANRIKRSNIRVGQVLSIPGQGKVRTSPEIEISDNQRRRKVYVEDNGVSRKSIISVAKRFLGAPYKFGGTSPVKGLDCSAFVNKVFGFFNVDLPRTAREIYKVGRDVDRSELAAGDLVFFRTYARYPSHVGIYIGDSEFIHASSKARKVRIDSMNLPYYRKRYIGARRIESAGLFYEELSKDYKGFEKKL